LPNPLLHNGSLLKLKALISISVLGALSKASIVELK
jgi:hypothetical protein